MSRAAPGDWIIRGSWRTPMSDPWTEERRGELIGYRQRYGRFRSHIARLTDNGPAAVSWTALCGGVESWCMVDSRLAAADDITQQGDAFKAAMPEWTDKADIPKNWAPNPCPRCATRVFGKGDR